MPFSRGDKVVGVNDPSRPRPIGEIVGLARTEQIKTVNEGLVGEKRIYMVRWQVPGGPAENELPEEALELASDSEVEAASD